MMLKALHGLVGFASGQEAVTNPNVQRQISC
jgi:hypothetical protein